MGRASSSSLPSRRSPSTRTSLPSCKRRLPSLLLPTSSRLNKLCINISAKNICSLITRRHPAIHHPGQWSGRALEWPERDSEQQHSIFRYFPAANKMSKKTFHSVLGHGSQPNIPGRSLSPLLSSVLARASLFLTSLYTCTVEATHVHTCAKLYTPPTV